MICKILIGNKQSDPVAESTSGGGAAMNKTYEALKTLKEEFLGDLRDITKQAIEELRGGVTPKYYVAACVAISALCEHEDLRGEILTTDTLNVLLHAALSFKSNERKYVGYSVQALSRLLQNGWLIHGTSYRSPKPYFANVA